MQIGLWTQMSNTLAYTFNTNKVAESSIMKIHGVELKQNLEEMPMSILMISKCICNVCTWEKMPLLQISSDRRHGG